MQSLLWTEVPGLFTSNFGVAAYGYTPDAGIWIFESRQDPSDFPRGCFWRKLYRIAQGRKEQHCHKKSE